jgi:hypothetical protein
LPGVVDIDGNLPRTIALLLPHRQVLAFLTVRLALLANPDEVLQAVFFGHAPDCATSTAVAAKLGRFACPRICANFGPT